MNVYKSNPVEVIDVKRHNPNEWSFRLRERIMGTPGQFVIVSVPGAGEVPISISGFYPDSFEITIRNIGKVTSEIFKLHPGTVLYIRGPYGNGFHLEEFKGAHLLVIAGGSAITTAKSLVEYYLGGGNGRLKRLSVLAGFRSPKHILFRDELNSWKKMAEVMVTVDNDEDYAWLGSIGFVVSFIKDVKYIGEDTRVVIIGPPLMMQNAVRELLQHNVKEENIWLSLERHMKCGLGKCGHCRINDKYVCTDGPVFNYKDAVGLID